MKNGAALDPAQFLHSSTSYVQQTALIILNSPLCSYKRFARLYNNACYVICADGGANRLYDLLTEQYPDHAYDTAISKLRPHAIHGDLDSIREGVRQAYLDLGVQVTLDEDQYSTDFQKAIKKVCEALPEVQHILVLGSLGGRVDQGIGLLHELFREQCHRQRRQGIQFWLFSESSVSWILRPGRSSLSTKLNENLLTRNVGLLPIYGPATISTTGLEWDVKEWQTSMGGNVSTSNHIMREIVEVETDGDILFTIELADST